MEQRTLIIGEPNQPEFISLFQWIRRRWEVVEYPTCRAAIFARTSIPAVDSIVFAQSHPGQFDQSGIEQLHAIWPLSRLFAVLGSWCEGESRSGRPLSGVWRTYWYDAPSIMGLYCDGSSRPAASDLPRTASDIDRLKYDLARLSRKGKETVVIAAGERSAFDSLAEGCRSLGYVPTLDTDQAHALASKPVAAIWDSRMGLEQDRDRFRNFADRFAAVPVILIAGFPRLDAVQELAERHIRVLAKPFRLPDLERLLIAPAITA